MQLLGLINIAININKNCIYQKSYDMRYSHEHTESKTVWYFCFRWSISEISSTAQTYLLFEDLCLTTIFMYKKWLK